MGNVAAIRTAIADKLRTVNEIGPVHEYERYAKTDAGIAALYQSGDQLRGWHIRRVRGRATSPSVGRVLVDYDWELRGVLSLQDATATEIQFDGLMESIAEAFQADESLGGAVVTTVLPDRAGIQLIESQPVMFAGKLCHFARLGLTTRFYR